MCVKMCERPMFVPLYLSSNFKGKTVKYECTVNDPTGNGSTAI